MCSPLLTNITDTWKERNYICCDQSSLSYQNYEMILAVNSRTSYSLKQSTTWSKEQNLHFKVMLVPKGGTFWMERSMIEEMDKDSH